jgi:starch synthase
MMRPLKILYLSAEVAPFAKTGGLGDVGGSLPKALQKLGHDVRVVMPAYRTIEAGYDGVDPVPVELKVPFNGTTLTAGIFRGTVPGSDVPAYFIARKELFDRPGIYGYWDDPVRFAFFSRAALEMAVATDWQPDVVHGHDWHTAPAIAWLATTGKADRFFQRAATLFTIHNLAHQGVAGSELLQQMGIHTFSLYEETFGQVNFMARGIYHADLVNTVSPTYAREILTLAGGAGLDGLLRHRQGRLHGILNGLDYAAWNPCDDSRLANSFGPEDLANRHLNKVALQQRAGLLQADDIPLVAMITRLDWQKGLDITGGVVEWLMNSGLGDVQFIVLGTGDPQYEAMFASLEARYPNKMRAILTYNAGLAPLIYGGSDLFLMPSLFEPCGLGQLIAMRYGSIPLVRATGGLADTVEDLANGFSFTDFSEKSLAGTLERAIKLYRQNRGRWQEIQRNGMLADFSWERSARSYQQLYEWAIASV